MDIKHSVLLLAFTVGGSTLALGQSPACPQVVATLSVAGSTYAEASAAPFEGRVFAYAPVIAPGGPSGFQPFQLWIVEGIYGRPFVRTSGPLDPASFDKLRGSSNVRATPIAVARGNGSDGGMFRIGREQFSVQVLRVSGGSVQARICR